MPQNDDEFIGFGYESYYLAPHITRELVNKLTTDEFITMMVLPFIIRVDVPTMKYIMEIWEGIKAKQPHRVRHIHKMHKPVRDTYACFYFDPRLFSYEPRG